MIMDTSSNIMEDTAPDLNQRIAERVRELRASQGLSLEALAALCRRRGRRPELRSYCARAAAVARASDPGSGAAELHLAWIAALDGDARGQIELVGKQVVLGAKSFAAGRNLA